MKSTTHSHQPGAGKQSNKSFKSRHATKGELKDRTKGKVNRDSTKNKSKIPTKKADRKNAAKLAQQAKREELSRMRRCVGGLIGATKLVAFIPLCPDVEARPIFEKVVSHEDLKSPTDKKISPSTVIMDKFRQKFTFFYTSRNLWEILEATKVADFIVLIYSPDEEVDEFGELCLASILAQGVPSVVNVVANFEILAQKKKNEVKKALLSYIADFFPEDQKLFQLDSDSDILNFLRHISTAHPREILWRERHPYMFIENFEFSPKGDGENGTLKVTGYSRGKPFSANNLVHLQSYGDFQVEKIESCPDPRYLMKFEQRKERSNSIQNDSEMSVDQKDPTSGPVLLDEPNPELQETLISENTPDPLANEQTIIGDDELEAAELEYQQQFETKKKKVPKGTSTYQAAWLDDDDDEADEDEDEEGSDNEDMSNGENEEGEEEEEEEEEEEFEEISVEDRATAFDEQFDEKQEDEDLQKYLQEKSRQNQDDLMFPDEIDVPMNTSLKQRFGKYRGLKSFRTSPWDPYENLPLEYGRIFDFQNFKHTQKRVLEDSEGVDPYAYITISISNVPSKFVQENANSKILTLFGLLKHEHKTSVIHFSVTRHSSYTEPIRSKEDVIICSGFRTLSAKPIYSENSTGNKHKFERFFQTGRNCVATIFGPIQYTPSPVLFFKDNGPNEYPSLIATGSLLGVDGRRVCVKRIVLTGSPYKINKRHATIRYMFFNPQDINWFKPVELYTKYGKSGHIRESLGTHGHMKCVFNGQLNAQDVVCMALYKRVYPKWKAETYKRNDKDNMMESS